MRVLNPVVDVADAVAGAFAAARGTKSRTPMRTVLFDLWYLLLPRYSRAAFHGDRVFQRLLEELVTRLGVGAFVETGTFLGISTAFVATQCPDLPIHTFEVNPEYFRRARRRLRKFPNVTLSCGSSDVSLRKLLEQPRFGGPTLFFLDAHWYDFWPLATELELISRSERPAIVMIDDFQVPGIPEFGHDAYGMRACSLEMIVPNLRRGNVYHILFPQYSVQDARLENTPEDLRGYAVIFQNLPQEFERLRRTEFVTRYYRGCELF